MRNWPVAFVLKALAAIYYVALRKLLEDRQLKHFLYKKLASTPYEHALAAIY